MKLFIEDVGGQTFLGEHWNLGGEEWKRWGMKESERAQMVGSGYLHMQHSFKNSARTTIILY